MRLLRFVFPRYAVFILGFLSHYGEAMQSADRSWATAIQDVHNAANQCSGVTGGSSAEMRQAANLICEQVFQSLDRLHVNICHGWRNAKCRRIPGEEAYQCSVEVPPCVLEEAFGGREKILTVDTCASELFNTDPTRRTPPPSLSKGASSGSSRDRGKRTLEGTSQRQDTGGTGGWSSANPFETGGTGSWGGADTSYPRGYYQSSGYSHPTRPSPPRSPTRATIPPPRVYPSVWVPPSGGTAPSAARVFPSALVPPSSGTSNVDQFTGYSFGDSLPGTPRRTPPPPSPALPVDPSFGVSAYGYGSDDELEHEGGTSNLPPIPASWLPGLSRKRRQNTGDFTCLDCGKSYTYKKQFEKHTAKHDKEGRKYTCPKCENPTSFRTKKMYKEHMESNHKEGVFFECNEDNCGRTFPNVVQLRLHKDKDHFGGTTCQICRAFFQSRQMLQIHMKTCAQGGSTNAP